MLLLRNEQNLPELIVCALPYLRDGDIRVAEESESVEDKERKITYGIRTHEALRAAGLYDQVSQAFAVYLPVKAVGVVGDARRYEHVIALRAVETVDFMTARWARLPFDLLEQVSARIINELPQVSRVVYDISSKPPATIEWE